MSMFHNPPPKLQLPKGAKESFVVRYPGGRKPFATDASAMTFAKAERAKDKGWAEVTRCIEIIVSPR